MDTQSTYPPEDDEDTIELELTAEEMRGLSRAANEAHASTDVFVPAPLSPPTSPPPATGKGGFRLWPVAVAAALIGIAAASLWRPGVTRRIAQPLVPPPAANVTPPMASQPTLLATAAEPPPTQEPQRPPVRVRNPFDGREVFEFPAGTTRAEARQKVSQLLLQRAVDRGSAGQGVEPAAKQRAKNN